MNTKLLICTCGDCKHWEIGKDEKGPFIVCMTCGEKFEATVIQVKPHGKLRYEERTATKPAATAKKTATKAKGKKTTKRAA